MLITHKYCDFQKCGDREFGLWMAFCLIMIQYKLPSYSKMGYDKRNKIKPKNTRIKYSWPLDFKMEKAFPNLKDETSPKKTPQKKQLIDLST